MIHIIGYSSRFDLKNYFTYEAVCFFHLRIISR